jgi:transcriptional regulator with GAF, ATPase, and Fis domain
LEIDPDFLGTAANSAPSASQPTSLVGVERAYIASVLQQTNWVIDGPKGAAKILDLHPNTLRSRLKKLGIHRDSHDPS